MGFYIQSVHSALRFVSGLAHQRTVYRVSLLPRTAKTGFQLRAWLIKYATHFSNTFQRVPQDEVKAPKCVQTAEKKNNLGDVPVSHQTAEAKVLFTWFTYDTTRRARGQEQTGHNFKLSKCVYIGHIVFLISVGTQTQLNM